MRFDIGTLDSGERSLPFGLLVLTFMVLVSHVVFDFIKVCLGLNITGLNKPRHEKTCLQVCDQVRHKPACAATEAG